VAPVLLFLDALAPVLGLASASATRRYVLREGVPFVRIGRRMAVRASTLDAWLAERETVAEGAPAGPPPVPEAPAWARDLLRRRRKR
jgi:hypothetical protein